MRKFKLMVLTAAAVLLASISFAAAQASPVSSGIVVAQGGSTGGTIGKRGKSASGSDVRSAPRRTARPAAVPSSRRKTVHTSASGCNRIPGVWDWTDAYSSVEHYRANGTVTSTSMKGIGRWTCRGRTVVIHWPNGVTERQTASNGFTRMRYVNSFGIASVGTRRGGN